MLNDIYDYMNVGIIDMKIVVRLLASISILLTGCGGGGGGGSENTPSGTTPSATTPSATTDLAPNGQILTITSLTLSPSDVIATTKPTTQTVAIWSIFQSIENYSHRFINKIIPSSFAVVTQPTYPPLTYDSTFSVSRKLINGNLTRIDPTVKYFETDVNGNKVEKKIQCDFNNTEINIKKSYELNIMTGDMLVLADVPNTVDKNCKVGFKATILYAKSSGEVYDVTTAFKNEISDVVLANDPGFNNSNSPLVVDSTGLIKVMELQSNGSLVLTDLNTVSAPINTNYTGSYAYDGKMLIGASADSNGFQSATYFVFQKGSTAFKIFRPTGAGWNTNFYLSSILDDQGRILFHYASAEFQVLNTNDWSYSTLLPQGSYTLPGTSVVTPTGGVGFVGNMFGAQGRYGKWILSDRGVLWNYETKESACLMTYPNTNATGVDDYSKCAFGGKYVRLWGRYAYTVDKNADNFVRYDVSTGKGVSVSLASKGYIVKDFTVFKDLVMVQVVNSQNSDKKFVEINYETGAVIERGIISLGGRSVDTFIPIGK